MWKRKPILDPNFWRERIEKAKLPHQAICKCSASRWTTICNDHTALLKDFILPDHSVLDVGCASGDLLYCMPSDWKGEYLGIDISPDFIKIAATTWPERTFVNMGINTLPFLGRQFDVAILRSIRGMVVNNEGEEVWAQLEKRIKEVADVVAVLEYGVIESTQLEIID